MKVEEGGQLHARAALPPGPLGGPQSRSRCCEEEKNLTLAGNRTPAVQPIARRSTDWAIPTGNKWKLNGAVHQLRKGFRKVYFSVMSILH
jgi:hypothetical protein